MQVWSKFGKFEARRFRHWTDGFVTGNAVLSTCQIRSFRIGARVQDDTDDSIVW